MKRTLEQQEREIEEKRREFQKEHEVWEDTQRQMMQEYVSNIHLAALSLATLKYFCINSGAQKIFQFQIVMNVLVASFI